MRSRNEYMLACADYTRAKDQLRTIATPTRFIGSKGDTAILSLGFVSKLSQKPLTAKEKRFTSNEA